MRHADAAANMACAVSMRCEARMARLWLGVLVVVALGAFGVAWMIARPPAPKAIPDWNSRR